MCRPVEDVEDDETYVGGKTTGGKRGRGAPNKTVVFGMLERDGARDGESLSRTFARKHFRRRYQRETGERQHHSYRRIEILQRAFQRRCFEHETVNHGAGNI